MVTSVLDTDLYKLTTANAVLERFPDARATFRFACRNPQGNQLLVDRAAAISDAISQLKDLRLTADERGWLAENCPFLGAAFIDWLSEFRFNVQRHVRVEVRNGEFELAVRGPWLETTLFEVPLLATISEVALDGQPIEGGAKRIIAKAQALGSQNLPARSVIEFGTRRRRSSMWQRQVFRRLLAATDSVYATSNPSLAMEFDIPCKGSMPHEWLMAGQVLNTRYADLTEASILDSQLYALETWLEVYNDHKQIALTDCLGIDVFLRQLDDWHAGQWKGFRHDSGDPYQWGWKLARRLTELGIDPKTRMAIWSDSLDPEIARGLWCAFGGIFGDCQFGIGTNLTNDTGGPRIDGVIKLTSINDKPVAKISDSPGKGMSGSDEWTAVLRRVFKMDAPAAAAIEGTEVAA